MLLARETILRELKIGNIEIRPFDIAQLNINSYDITLGNWFYYVKLIKGERVYFGPKYFEQGSILPLPCGVGFLAMAKEFISTTGNVVCQMKAKSSTGRSFFSVCNDAGLGDVGYRNHWVMEIINYLQGTASLAVGDCIAQITFLQTTPTSYSYNGQYTGSLPESMVPQKYRKFVQPWSEEQERLWRLEL